ncbi:MAG: hypothetical protein KC483_02990 [Nitrosarchaeum sp.]|nr:hypothetical protein [Nitrosarchaeum sp.]
MNCIGGSWGSPNSIEKSLVNSIKKGRTIRITGIAVSIIPRKRQLRPFLGSSYFIANHAINPPTNPPKMGKTYHKSLRLRVTMLSNMVFVAIID